MVVVTFCKHSGCSQRRLLPVLPGLSLMATYGTRDRPPNTVKTGTLCRLGAARPVPHTELALCQRIGGVAESRDRLPFEINWLILNMMLCQPLTILLISSCIFWLRHSWCKFHVYYGQGYGYGFLLLVKSLSQSGMCWAAFGQVNWHTE